MTEREIAQSKDLAGVNMRLTSGSFRELHWHRADEWAIMLTGSARVSVMQPDGKMFIDDVARGDLWYFPAGFPHSIQGLEGPGCEFLLVFDQGNFSEDDTFLLSELLAHIPPEVIQKNMGWTRQEWDQLPPQELYIFPAELPGPLEADKHFLGSRLETERKYTFHGAMTMATSHQTAGGTARVIDSTNFPVAKNIATGIVTLQPGALRELHWHPNGSEWQYWIQGNGNRYRCPSPLNTTSATLSEVIGHAAVVQLPLNGRQFTQLALLTPGVAPQEGGQQQSFMVSLGAGGIVPVPRSYGAIGHSCE